MRTIKGPNYDWEKLNRNLIGKRRVTYPILTFFFFKHSIIMCYKRALEGMGYDVPKDSFINRLNYYNEGVIER